jgi:uncharacterized protein with PIN domain
VSHITPDPRLLTADAMLARLARWLRVLGFDTFYDPSLHDHALVQLSNTEARTLLTRDRHLLRELRPLSSLEITHDSALDQLHQTVTALKLPAPPELFTRCMVCNTVLSAPLPRPEADALVPEGVRGIPGPIRRCPSCGRVYWLGSHARRMREAIDRTLPGWLPASGADR